MRKAALVVALTLLIEIPGSSISAGYDSIFKRNLEPLEVALTFDYEEYASDYTMRGIFSVLDKHNATATFFIVGKIADSYPAVIKEIHERNYSLGLHTYYHHYPVLRSKDAVSKAYKARFDSELIFSSWDEFYTDLKRNQEAASRATGGTAAIFRALEKAGIKIDSSIHQNFSSPRPWYRINGIIEVPVVSSDHALKNISYGLWSGNCSKVGVPYVLFLHSHKLSEKDIAELDRLLTYLEGKYIVTYLKIEQIPEYYRLGDNGNANG